MLEWGRRWSLVAIFLLAACGPIWTSEQGQLQLSDGDVFLGEQSGNPAPLLVGTRTCPDLGCVGDCPDAFAECFVPTVQGDGHVDGDCVVADAAGELDWAFAATPCAANAEGYEPVDDHVRVPIVGPDEVTARPLDVEALVRQAFSPGPEASFPADVSVPAGEPWRLVAGSPFAFLPSLFLGSGTEVGYEIAAVTGRAEALSGTAATVATTDWADLVVTAAEGGSSRIWFGVRGDEWPLVDVEGVSPDEVASIEVVVAYNVDSETGDTWPAGARAVVRDAAGGLLWGLPVTWTLREGLLAVGGETTWLPGGDYVVLADACVRPSENVGAHEAVLEASFEGVSATASLAWEISVPGDDADWVQDPGCPGASTTPDDDVDTAKDGCGCRAGGGGWWVAALLLVRRRR